MVFFPDCLSGNSPEAASLPGEITVVVYPFWKREAAGSNPAPQTKTDGKVLCLAFTGNGTIAKQVYAPD